VTSDYQATRLRGNHQDAMLTSEEIALIRRTLAACSQVLTWADQHGGHQFREIIAEATHAAEGNRSPAGLAYHVNLAIDYPDFAPAARSTPRPPTRAGSGRDEV
jgi:hypothetical protein